MTAAGLVVFSLVVMSSLIWLNRMAQTKPIPTGNIHHGVVIKIISNGEREHTIEIAGVRSWQRFCEHDPFYPGMTAKIDFEDRGSCWDLLTYHIERSNEHGTVSTSK